MPVKISFDELEKLVKGLRDDKLINTYVKNMKTMLSIECHHCKTNYNASISNFKNGKCNCKCQIEKKRIQRQIENPTYKHDITYVKSYIKDNSKDDYGGKIPEFLKSLTKIMCEDNDHSECDSATCPNSVKAKNIIDTSDTCVSTSYEGAGTNLDILCGKCKKVYNTNFNYYVNKRKRCECRKTGRKTYSFDLVKRIIADVGDILKSTEYVSTTKLLDIECGVCHENYTRSWQYYFYQGNRCKCLRDHQYTEAEFKELVHYGGDELVGKFQTVNHKVQLKCGICSVDYEMKGHHFIDGSRHRDCVAKETAKKFKLSFDTVIKTIEETGEKCLSYANEYDNYDSILRIECNNCMNEYSKSYFLFKCGGRCPKCYDPMSIGERKVATILELRNVSYKSQYRFPNCKNILPLPFDFYLDEYNAAIEYHGIQHYEIVEYFGGEKGFIERQARDKIKVEYWENSGNSDRLLIISYKDFYKIDSIIADFIHKLKNNLIKISS